MVASPASQLCSKIKISRSVKIKDVISALECFAPLPLQCDYDNAGLQVGLTEAEVSGVLLCLDITEAIVLEAEKKGCNMIVSHHPLIFRKLRQVTDADYVQRSVMMAIQKGITIVSMHTNLDAAEGGVNYMIARKLDAIDVQLFDAHEVNGVKGGEGVMATLAEPLSAQQLIEKVKEAFGAERIMANELLERPIRKVAICGGAGSDVLGNALRHGADAFITGEMSYHMFFGLEQQLQLLVFGHYETEQFTPQLLKEIITERCPEVRCEITEINTNPIKYY